jgi:hypothetical protein
MTRRVILGISIATTVGVVFLTGLAVGQKNCLRSSWWGLGWSPL